MCVGGGGGDGGGRGRGDGGGGGDLRPSSPVICIKSSKKLTDYTCYQGLFPGVLVYSSSYVGSNSG